MSDTFLASKEWFSNAIADIRLGKLQSFCADPWIISSLLQKSIRRGETEIVQRAAVTFLSQRGSAIWRRLMIIAFEDIGAGSPMALAATVAVGSDPTFRTTIGGNAVAAAGIAHVLSQSAKDRSADYLGCGPRFHASLFTAPPGSAGGCLKQHLCTVADHNAPLFLRTVAAWYACGIGRERDKNGDLPALLHTYRELGVPEALIEATGIAAKRTNEPMTVTVPLIWLAAHAGPKPTIEQCPLPPLVCEGDIPLYALDEHTRLGRNAIFRFAQENAVVRHALESYALGSQRRAANLAAFYADAFPITPRLKWQGCVAAEEFGINNDFLIAQVSFEGIGPLLDLFRQNLGELNEFRREVLRHAPRRGNGVGKASAQERC